MGKLWRVKENGWAATSSQPQRIFEGDIGEEWGRLIIGGGIVLTFFGDGSTIGVWDERDLELVSDEPDVPREQIPLWSEGEHGRRIPWFWRDEDLTAVEN